MGYRNVFLPGWAEEEEEAEEGGGEVVVGAYSHLRRKMSALKFLE